VLAISMILAGTQERIKEIEADKKLFVKMEKS
jgi:hypothetical protein